MNVAFDPWIPVVTISGKPELVSLTTVLCEGEQFADLAVRPHERVALMRLLLCVSHAALDGPKDYDEWLEVPKRLSDAVRKYLTKWKDSFELFHREKPWLQIVGLKGVEKKAGDSGKTSPVALLDFELATGNSSTLTDHSGILKYRPVSPEKTALNLLTFQNLSLLMTHIEAIGTDDAIPTRKKWREMLFQSACDAYRITCSQETPRQMRAFARGWQTLTATKIKPETHTDNQKEKSP